MQLNIILTSKYLALLIFALSFASYGFPQKKEEKVDEIPIFLNPSMKSMDKDIVIGGNGWNELTSISQLHDILKKSSTKTIILFKHSTKCNISKGVLLQFQKEWDSKNKNVELYYLDLIRYRDVSNAIEKKLVLKHESPQIIVIKNEKVIYSESHKKIEAKKVKKIIS
jgi:bacillithiol system protein YtxJ